MKVELDLSAEQLQNLDKDLTNLLNNLTEEQKIDIIKGYINYQFDRLTYEYKNTWGSKSEEISEFGKRLISGLQEQITKSISEDIMKDENLLKVIDETIKNVESQLQTIIKDAISTYIIDNLFMNKNDIKQNINNQIWNYMSNRG